MSRELRCKNKHCEDKEPIFLVEIEVSKYLEHGWNSVPFTQYPINHFTCASCGLIPIEVKV
tara:strand:+ start:807 stop:989 length:183 start_codon:yes stop_codon:yes gene_type:complete